jgi:hypothetical protein
MVNQLWVTNKRIPATHGSNSFAQKFCRLQPACQPHVHFRINCSILISMTQHFRSLLISCCDFLHQLYHRKCLTHDVFCTIFVRLNVATFESVNPASAEQPTASMRHGWFWGCASYACRKENVVCVASLLYHMPVIYVTPFIPIYRSYTYP